MIELKRYQSGDAALWDQFLLSSRADTFLFLRKYMDYHADRFSDHSFLIYRKGKLHGVLPGNSFGSTFFSHQGLTYGGLVLPTAVTATEVLYIFNLLNEKLSEDGIEKVIYKPLPYIYQKLPAQEDVYALFKLGAVKIGCNLSSTIYQRQKIQFTESRKSGIRKSKQANISIETSVDFKEFWTILENTLQNRHKTKPAHTVDEISLLQKLFPENIRLHVAMHGSETVAGCVMYIMEQVVHVQYISANEKGKQTGALDLLFDKLINEVYLDFPVFDFGSSTVGLGEFLNESLIFQKEGFGGRGTLYEIYQYSL
ncbi:MAG: GNAT family N-acetyltransferase [Bacteroidetes bacterium]|nr:GNAT family N-acetyltransferase [Bacteroidota bacterium]